MVDAEAFEMDDEQEFESTLVVFDAKEQPVATRSPAVADYVSRGHGARQGRRVHPGKAQQQNGGAND